MKKVIVISAPLFFLLLFILLIALSGFPGIKSKCGRVTGVVTAIYEDGTKDAVFKLEGQKSVFYINRGLENGFNLNLLIEKLKGRKVNILYSDNWTPLGSIAECRHISELSTDNETLYSEFEAK